MAYPMANFPLRGMQANMCMYVKDREPKQKWEHGRIFQLHHHEPGKYEIEPALKSAKTGEWDDIPRTIHTHNYDPIPNVDFRRNIGEETLQNVRLYSTTRSA